ncbi:MAG: hypothetical protein AAFY65_11320 [Pseudomonadota bacterium]
MDTTNRAPVGSCLVIHENALVAEDIRDVVSDFGATDVRVFRTLADARDQLAWLVILAGSYDQVLADPITQRWLSAGASLIVLNGRHRDSTSGSNVYSLEQPFRSDELEGLLTSTGLFP